MSDAGDDYGNGGQVSLLSGKQNKTHTHTYEIQLLNKRMSGWNVYSDFGEVQDFVGSEEEYGGEDGREIEQDGNADVNGQAEGAENGANSQGVVHSGMPFVNDTSFTRDNRFVGA
jgi:hypothetical protein